MHTLLLKCEKAPNQDCAKANKIYISSDNLSIIPNNPKFVKIGSFLFLADSYPKLSNDTVSFNTEQRKLLQCSLQQDMKLNFKYEEYQCTSVTFEISYLARSKERRITLDADKLREAYKKTMSHLPLNLSQGLIFLYEGEQFILKITELEGGLLDKNAEIVPKENILSCFFNLNVTAIQIKKASESQIMIEDNSVQHKTTVIRQDFNYQDIGIGGLDAEFSTIFRRAFYSRLFPPKLIRERGIKHVKGILLYGPPGTGKTLIARQIGKMLNTVEPKVINGPEILDKYVGEGERKIRELFADAEKDQAENGDNAQLHLIIFDEIDSICKKRGSAGALSGVGDTIVNQLLSKIDGINALNNVLLIGMTNRKDMIDEALLRPGRLEVQLMINLPDQKGREEIFNIHTKKLRECGALTKDVDMKKLAELTPNYTGAEIEGVVKSAQSFALNSGFDAKTMELKTDEKLPVTFEHFKLAIQEVRPAFGVEEDIKQLCNRGITEFSEEFQNIKKHVSKYIKSLLESKNTSLMSFCIYGLAGCGLTSFAVSIAKQGFNYVKLILPKKFIGRSEDSIALEILESFENAYKSKESAIIIDDIDSLIEFSPIGPRFSNKILQALLVLLKQPPPPGHKLVIFAITSKRESMSMIGIDSRYFYEEIELGPLRKLNHIIAVAKDACNAKILISKNEIQEADEFLSENPVPVKRAIEAIDFLVFDAKEMDIEWNNLKGFLRQHNRISID